MIALIWIINGLICKLLNFVPRHEQIVARILGHQYSGLITKLIGVSELIMAVWILSGYKSKLNVITQVVVIILMNMLELLLAPDLLLFGTFNFLNALLLASVICINYLVMAPKPINSTQHV